MDMHKTVRDGGDTRKLEKSKTSVVGQVNKIVSERGDSKKVFVHGKVIERTKTDYNKSNEVKTKKETDTSLKPDKTSNEARTEKENFIDRDQESITVSTSKNDAQNITKDIGKRSYEQQPFRSFPVNRERRPTVTAINKNVEMLTTQRLDTDVTKIRVAQKSTTKDITKISTRKELGTSSLENNEPNIPTKNVCDKNIKVHSKQEFVTNGTFVRKNDYHNMARKDTDVSKPFEGQVINRSFSQNNKRTGNISVSINDPDLKTGKRELNSISTQKHDLEITNTKNNQKRHDVKETIRTINDEHGQNITINVKEDKMPRNIVCNKKYERAEKKNVGEKDIKAINLKSISTRNTGESPRLNVKSQNDEAKIKNDQFPKKLPQQIKETSQLSEAENKMSHETGIFSSDNMEKITLPVLPSSQLRKRPLIKTITTRNDKVKFYKSVAFVDEKKNRTPLKINLADAFKQTKINPDRRVKITTSRDSIKEKVVKKKEILKKVRNKRKPSPKYPPGPQSPHTEVAKWAPNSINNHTKLYYEAWVDTTLAAMPKNSRNEKFLLENQNIFKKALQKALAEGPCASELAHENLTDEKFTGRIKIRQR